jgi:hypothetical protein
VTPENKVKKAVLEFLALRGITAFRVNSGAMRSTHKGKARMFWFVGMKGVSDILGVIPPHGRFLAIETKVKPRKATADQQKFLDMVNSSGGLGIVAYTLDDVMEALP